MSIYNNNWVDILNSGVIKYLNIGDQNLYSDNNISKGHYHLIVFV